MKKSDFCFLLSQIYMIGVIVNTDPIVDIIFLLAELFWFFAFVIYAVKEAKND